MNSMYKCRVALKQRDKVVSYGIQYEDGRVVIESGNQVENKEQERKTGSKMVGTHDEKKGTRGEGGWIYSTRH